MTSHILKSLGMEPAVTLLGGRPWLCSGRNDDPLDPSYDGYSGGDDEQDDGEGEDEHEPTRPKSRFKSHEEAERGYTELQSAWDRTKHENKELSQRLSTLEQEIRAMREPKPGELPAWQQKGLKVAEEMYPELSRLDAKDPEYSKKYLAILASTLLRETESLKEEFPKAAKEVYSREELEREAHEQAVTTATRLLDEYGFTKEHLGLLVGLRDQWTQQDPTWMERTPPDQQIPMLVQAYAKLHGKERQSREADESRDDELSTGMPSRRSASMQDPAVRQKLRDEQRRRAAGGMASGAKVQPNNGTGGGDKGNQLGSFISDLKTMREQQRKHGQPRDRFAAR